MTTCPPKMSDYSLDNYRMMAYLIVDTSDSLQAIVQGICNSFENTGSQCCNNLTVRINVHYRDGSLPGQLSSECNNDISCFCKFIELYSQNSYVIFPLDGYALSNNQQFITGRSFSMVLRGLLIVTI
ncbi:hypothetical protein EG68_04348 [Paragonimus skrjabini miyazakii]|uniref:Uncharacterized protein n=1 Tax=Paragonimus skrjabini miyazakii TaxID=59628 RepID=A0A8S9YYF1_9TREM|nr:hypothetical protein EG68_04348 [Paragonimus skrjabini miyazakii]